MKLTPVPPPADIDFVASINRFRRYLEGTTLVVQATVGLSWQPPPKSSDFSITGYDGYLSAVPISGYISRNDLPANQLGDFQVSRY